jgi:predicted esterase
MLHEHHLTVERTARFFTLEPGEGGAREVWTVCHGYSQLAARFLRYFAAIDDGTRLVVAPEALSRYYVHEDPGEGTGRGAGARASGPHAMATHVGASWMTREDRLAEVADTVAYLDALARHVTRGLTRPPERTVALGFSQGAAAAARWAVLGGATLDRLILWGGGLPPDLDLEGRRPTLRDGVRLVWGEKDPYYDPARLRADEERLARAGLACETVLYAGGHHLSRDVLARLTA